MFWACWYVGDKPLGFGFGSRLPCPYCGSLFLISMHLSPCRFPKVQATWSRVCGYVEQQVPTQKWLIHRWLLYIAQSTTISFLLRGLPDTRLRPAFTLRSQKRLPFLRPHTHTPHPGMQDIHSGRSTVRESLVFSARLRLASDIPDSKVGEFECCTWLGSGGLPEGSTLWTAAGTPGVRACFRAGLY